MRVKCLLKTAAVITACFVGEASQLLPAHGQIARLEVHAFGSMTLTDQQFLLGAKDGQPLTLAGELLDAYRALDFLSKHPRIDARRVAVTGFSLGGAAARFASIKRFQRMHGTPGLEFAAYVPFYGSCGTTYIDDTDVSDKPILQIHGAADDYVPVAPCRSYFEWLKRAGKNAVLTEYPDAHHVFDYALLSTTPTAFPQNQTARRCVLREEPMGRVINAQTGQPFTWKSDPCVELGPHIAYNAMATEAAVADVKSFLRAALKLD